MNDVQATDPPQLAIPKLLELHGGRLYHLGLRLCNDPEDAQDMVQETFLQAFRRWDQFEGRSSPVSWLFTIAARICQRMHRKRSGEPDQIESLEELLPMGEPELGVVPPDEVGVSVELRREARERVGEAVAALPLAFRMPLVLKDIVGLSVEEVANILGLKAATVKTRVYRARLKVRQQMEQVLPRAQVPPPAYSRQVCLDLLQAKQEALDRGVPFPVENQVLCDRCQAVFRTMDLAQEVCRDIAQGELPDELEKALLELFGSASGPA